MSSYFFPLREPFNAISHLIGALVALGWLVLLMWISAGDESENQIAFFVYGLSVFLMFASSAIYHSVNVSFRTEELFRRIDHIMIYLVIAGSYTPLCVIVLEGRWQAGMLAGIWTFALAGFLKKLLWLNAPRWFSTMLYLLMGWVSVIIFPQIWSLLPLGFSVWIIIGGLFYTIGAVVYVIKRPNPIPGHFGFHEIWHLFVMGGAFSHFWANFYYLPGY